MQINELINSNRTACKLEVNSKKRALESLSTLLAETLVTPTGQQIFEKLLEREKLGSTGVGQGVAIPHCRIQNLDHIMIAFASLEHGIDFDALDNKSVDLILAILVPETCTETHLNVLASAAQMFSDTQFCDILRCANSSQKLYELIANWKPKSMTA